MKIFKTNLQGVLKIKLKPFKDLRGYYLEIFNKNLFKRTKKKINFIQDDISVSKKNVLRGIHGDYKTWKLVSCLSGELFFLVVNNIKRHKQYQKSQMFKLSESNNLEILVPPGFGNGHYVTSKKAIFHYKQSTLYDRSSQFTINWKDPKYRYKWPKNLKPITSKRDK